MRPNTHLKLFIHDASLSNNQFGFITVGPHHNSGRSSSNDSPGFEFVASFSSRGPTANRRMKHGIVAPEDYILLARALPGKIGECYLNDASLPKSGDFEGRSSLYIRYFHGYPR